MDARDRASRYRQYAPPGFRQIAAPRLIGSRPGQQVPQWRAQFENNYPLDQWRDEQYPQFQRHPNLQRRPQDEWHVPSQDEELWPSQYLPVHPQHSQQLAAQDQRFLQEQRLSEHLLLDDHGGGFPDGKRRRLVSEIEQGTSELMESLGVSAQGGRKVFIVDSNCVEHVPTSVDDTLKFWKWLQSKRPPVDMVQNKDQVWELLRQPATPIKLPASFLLHVRQQQQVANDIQLMAWQTYEMQRRGQTLTNLAASARVEVKAQECPEVLLWKEEVVKRNVPRISVSIDEVLVPARHLVAEFRYLHFLLFDSRKTTVDEVVAMRSTRGKDQSDKEVPFPYHPLLLCFCRAAASGQPEVNFFGEVHEGCSREAICLMVNQVSQPSEVMETFQAEIPGAESGIDRNKVAFARMLKCNKKDQQPWHLGILADRIEHLWFALFEYADDCTLKSIRVAPEFVWDRRNLLFDVWQLDKAKPGTTLDHVSPMGPQPGFNLLVRYVDTLCDRMGIPVSPIQLITEDREYPLDLTGAILVGQGPKSLVLRTGEHVVKVSKTTLVRHELAIHAVADGLDCVRPLVKGLNGVVKGAGDGLGWLSLRGFGRHLRESDVLNNYDALWQCGEKALYGLHGRDVFHRDVKPSNFLLIHGVLELNDFDASCFIDDAPDVLRQRVGTPYFESAFIQPNHEYQFRDDWCSLVLTFLSLHSAYIPGTDKAAAMQRAVDMDGIPRDLKACIQWIHSADAAAGKSRQPVSIRNEQVEQSWASVKLERKVKRREH